jgi:hypothetical protein|tara:strand:- start:460 stop:717 length:258 start_codon:yes stop_codon:yes gene_type:complete
MAYVPKEGSGSLFKNDRKTTENHPDYTGTIMVNNRECYLSAWVKEGTKGKFFSVSIGKEKQPKGFTAKGSDELPRNTIEDSDLPF